MPLSQLLFSLEGRIPRSVFWRKFILPVTAISLIMGFIDVLLWGGGFLYFIFVLFIIWPYTAVSVKRLHDRNKSGGMLLLLLIPIVGTVWYFIDVGCLDGTEGENRYGPDPKEPSNGVF